MNKIKYKWRYSRKGVPHVLITNGVDTLSVCYMRRKRIYRLFSDYGASVQLRTDFKTLEEAWRHARVILS
jgi:hypothetical protein